jgi:hypothetical protein
MGASQSVEIKPGVTFRAVMADCNALWKVTKRAGKGVWWAECVNEPITFDGRTIDSDYAGTERVFTDDEIRRSAAWERVFADTQTEQEKRWAGAKDGDA